MRARYKQGNFLWKVKERLIGQKGEGLVRQRPAIGSLLLWCDALVQASSPPPSPPPLSVFAFILPSLSSPPSPHLTFHLSCALFLFSSSETQIKQESTKQSFDSKNTTRVEGKPHRGQRKTQIRKKKESEREKETKLIKLQRESRQKDKRQSRASFVLYSSILPLQQIIWKETSVLSRTWKFFNPATATPLCLQRTASPFHTRREYTLVEKTNKPGRTSPLKHSLHIATSKPFAFFLLKLNI